MLYNCPPRPQNSHVRLHTKGSFAPILYRKRLVSIYLSPDYTQADAVSGDYAPHHYQQRRRCSSQVNKKYNKINPIITGYGPKEDQ